MTEEALKKDFQQGMKFGKCNGMWGRVCRICENESISDELFSYIIQESKGRPFIRTYLSRNENLSDEAYEFLAKSSSFDTLLDLSRNTVPSPQVLSKIYKNVNKRKETWKFRIMDNLVKNPKFSENLRMKILLEQ